MAKNDLTPDFDPDAVPLPTLPPKPPGTAPRLSPDTSGSVAPTVPQSGGGEIEEMPRVETIPVETQLPPPLPPRILDGAAPLSFFVAFLVTSRYPQAMTKDELIEDWCLTDTKRAWYAERSPGGPVRKVFWDWNIWLFDESGRLTGVYAHEDQLQEQ